MRHMKMPFCVLKNSYLKAVQAKGFKEDPKQLAIINKMTSLMKQINTTHSQWKNYVSKIDQTQTHSIMYQQSKSQNQNNNSNNFIKGLYIYGNPGCGKTFLMSLLFQHLAIKEKLWSHYNQFMMDMSQQMHIGTQTKKDQMTHLTNKLVKQNRIIFLDQFQVTHISDAMVLKRVFQKAFLKKIILIVSSNRPPDDLYQNGLLRQRFQPFIPVLKKYCHSIDMDSKTDYRQLFRKSNIRQTYIHPLTKKHQALEIFEKAAQQEKETPIDIFIPPSRRFNKGKRAGKTALFTFEQICQSNLGPSDYMSIAQQFHTVIILNMKSISRKDLNAARRFIWLVDQFYQNKVKLVILANGPLHVTISKPENCLYDQQFAIGRISSRLQEMQSQNYLSSKASCQIQ